MVEALGTVCSQELTNRHPDVLTFGRGLRLIEDSLILAISFLSPTTSPDIVVQMIASGLAFGIVVDAVIGRTLLIPALVAIMGRWNRWMPDSLARLIRVPPAPSADRPAAA